MEETVLTIIEACHHKGELIAGTVIVGHLGLAALSEAHTQPQVHVRALIVHGVLGIDTYDAALAIATIEGALRTTQHVNSVELVEMGVEGRLRHQGDMVVIDTYGRVVQT